MAKKKAVTLAPPAPKPTEVIEPQTAHELLSCPGPYGSPLPPIPTKGYVTWWDCGMSINELRRRKKVPFVNSDWLDGQAFAKGSDQWRWREIRLDAAGTELTFEEQAAKLTKGYEPPLARELVTFLVVRFLVTGERLDVRWLRTKDVLPTGRRVIVSLTEAGIELGNVSDRWSSPGIGLAAAFTPVVKPRKR